VKFDLLKAQRRVFASDLKPLEKLVALSLVDHWSVATETFPSVTRLEQWTGLSRNAVLRALRSLDNRGAIRVTRDRGVVSRYDLTPLMDLPVPEKRQRATAEAAPTGATEEPVPEVNQFPSGTRTSAGEAPEPVPEKHPKEPTEGTQKEPTGMRPADAEMPRGPTPLQLVSLKPQRAKRPRPAQVGPLPLDWSPTDAHRAYAAKHRLNLELEVDALRGWAEGRTTPSWNGTFSTRLANAAKWRAEGGARPRPLVQRGSVPLRQGDASWLDVAK